MSALATPRPRRAPFPYRPALIGAGVLLLELVVALGIAEPRFTRLLVLPLAAISLALVFSFPFAASCLFLGLVASISLPAVALPVGPVDVRPYELLLGALLLVAAWVLIWIYVRWANRYYDVAIDAIRRQR